MQLEMEVLVLVIPGGAAASHFGATQQQLHTAIMWWPLV